MFSFVKTTNTLVCICSLLLGLHPPSVLADSQSNTNKILKILFESSTKAVLLRLDNIEITGDQRTATLVLEGSNLEVAPAQSMIGKYEMGCQTRTIRSLSLRYYAGKALSGKLVKNEPYPSNRRRVEGESLEEAIWNYICFRITPPAKLSD
jgi:hypothetical protein